MHLKPDAKPVFARAREIPYALRESYANGIKKRIASGLYEKVEFSEWTSTTHVVRKKTGEMQITDNFKNALNPCIIIDEHPVLRPEQLFNKLNGANIYCNLETDAYSHLPVD